VVDPELHRKPDYLPALYYGARIYWDRGRRDEAIDAFTRFLAADPANPDAYLQIAKAQAAAGRASEAIETLERGLAQAPHRRILVDLSWLLATHPDAARRDGRRAVALAEQAAAAGPPRAEPARGAAAAAGTARRRVGDGARRGAGRGRRLRPLDPRGRGRGPEAPRGA